MDARVDDFLNEINEIAPLKETPKIVWQECLDKESGYTYYWNMETDKVTWIKPSEYQSAKNNDGRVRPAPLFPSAMKSFGEVKIYKISDTIDPSPKTTTSIDNKKVEEKPLPSNAATKVNLIPYGQGSDSENEESEEVPKEKENSTSITTTEPTKPIETKTGLALVAGYSDSEEEDNAEVESILAPSKEVPKIAHSTLFPIAKPINVSDFSSEPTESTKDESFDAKMFQRKRRIGVALMNTKKAKEPKTDKDQESDDEGERKGFGFSKDSLYSGFKKGEVMFMKSESPSTKEEELKEEKGEKEGLENIYVTLKEKLDFLGEGRGEVMPVQVLLIQATIQLDLCIDSVESVHDQVDNCYSNIGHVQKSPINFYIVDNFWKYERTLYEAMKEGGLSLSYLKKWLNETSSELIQLEKDATPEGWNLQWDREHKRYYYQNQTTGESQWEYPQPDVVRCDEAMDISTTPPPTGTDNIHMSPPLPPSIRVPTPPPPPTLNHPGDGLPPGIEGNTKTVKNSSDTLDSALDSFYSDIAALENSNSPPPVPNSEDIKSENNVDQINDTSKKKKKTKVKLTQGLAMKKKGVSKLVEKWKHVHYND